MLQVLLKTTRYVSLSLKRLTPLIAYDNSISVVQMFCKFYLNLIHLIKSNVISFLTIKFIVFKKSLTLCNRCYVINFI